MASPNPGGNVYTAKTGSDDRFESWNKVIQDVNQLCTNPDVGCDPLLELEEVGPDHVWVDEDVEKVRNKLKEICDENEFDAELDYWMHDIVQEISDAIDNGWCNCCENIECEFGQEGTAGPPNIIIPGRWDLDCGDLCSYYNPGCGRGSYCRFMDWGSDIRGLEVGLFGYTGRSWIVKRYNVFTHVYTSGFSVFGGGNTGLISCEGIVEVRDTSGNKGMGLAEAYVYEVHVWFVCNSYWWVGDPPEYKKAQFCSDCEDGGGGEEE